MGQVLLLLVVALTVAAVVFGVAVLVTGRDSGLGPAEPDGRAVPLPGSRPLQESDVIGVRFDTAVRGYRMAQVDQAMRRTAYDIGYKDELIGVLEAEVVALREGRTADADELRRAREAALAPPGSATPTAGETTGVAAVSEDPAADETTETTAAPAVAAADETTEDPAVDPGDREGAGPTIGEPPAGEDESTSPGNADRTESATQVQAERP